MELTLLTLRIVRRTCHVDYSTDSSIYYFCVIACVEVPQILLSHIADLETVPPGFQHGIEFDQQKSTASLGKSAAFKGMR